MATVLCMRPWKGVYVTLNGDVTFCCYLPRPQAVLGNLGRSSLDAIWNSPKARQIRTEMLTQRLPGVCGGCPLFNYKASQERETDPTQLTSGTAC